MLAMNIHARKIDLFMGIYSYLLILLDRVGSEFWSQQVRIGNETTGIK